MTLHNCDLCGSSDRTEIEPGICVCMGCGFCYVPERRTPHEIAADWSNVYASGAYDPAWPGVRARLFFVAEWLDQKIGLAGKTVLDIGAGKGFFLELARQAGAHPVGLEPDRRNHDLVRSKDIACFLGAVEDHPNLGQYDLVTVLWTLENCGDCLVMLRWARNHLAPGGRVVVATGSRIRVPYKKSYKSYFGKLSPDLHCFRWERGTLMAAFEKSGLIHVENNDYLENDVLLCVARANDAEPPEQTWRASDPEGVVEFFRTWKRVCP